MAHGKQSLLSVRGSTEAFFQSGDVATLTRDQFEAQFLHTERVRVKRDELRDLASLVVRCGLRPTKADVRRLVA